jgi:hypothetical protein
VSIYYSPEKFAARIVGDVDTLGSYEFNMIAVFQRLDDGALFWGEDSGCSCFSPFEDAKSVGDLTRIDDPAVFATDARKWLRESYGTDADDRDGVEKLIRKVRDEFGKARIRKAEK